MDGLWVDRLARQVAGRGTTRRGLARLGVGGTLAGLALGPDAAAACRLPRKACTKGKQCCTGKCKQGKCASGATLLLAPDRLCWLAWGSLGSGDGQFDNPRGVAVGGNGHVYVADTSNNRIARVLPL